MLFPDALGGLRLVKCADRILQVILSKGSEEAACQTGSEDQDIGDEYEDTDIWPGK